jgi:hypothetical protein
VKVFKIEQTGDCIHDTLLANIQSDLSHLPRWGSKIKDVIFLCIDVQLIGADATIFTAGHCQCAFLGALEAGTQLPKDLYLWQQLHSSPLPTQ